MAVATAQMVKRQGRDGGIKSAPVAATKVIHEGTLVFGDANGLATDEKVDADTLFLGIARETVDNSGGVDGAKHVPFWTDGTFELPCAELVGGDRGVAIYATDNFTTTKTATDAGTVPATEHPQIGVLCEVHAANVGGVEIKGLGKK